MNLIIMINNNLQILDWGEISYADAWEQQKNLFTALIDAKSNNTPYHNSIIFCEHPHVYTIGKNGKMANILHNSAFYTQLGATVVEVERGGDVTYHGPGQTVVYPIINLEDYHLGVKDYIHLLEEAVILTCKHFGITATRDNEAIGVWMDTNTRNARKICAIGVKCSRYVSMHGLALNVNTDLNFFNHINPCGFVDKSVTSIKKEIGRPVDIDQVKPILKNYLVSLLIQAASKSK